MKFSKRLRAWLKDPHGVFLALFYAVAIASAVGAIFMASRENLAPPLNVVAYLLYALAAVTLGYSVYTIVRFVPRAKKSVTEFLQKYKFTNRLLEQYGFRTIMFTILSLTISIAYALFNGAAAIVKRSSWYGSLAAYYLLLAVMRGGVIMFHRSKRKRTDEEAYEEKRREIKIYKRCGAGLVVLPVCLSFAILQMVLGVNSFEHAGMMIYVSALYAVYKIVMSVSNFFKARRNDDLTVRAVRSINLADAFVSVLALQTAMFREFSGDMDVGSANAITGTAVCVLTAVLGAFMIVNGCRESKKLQKEKTDGRTGQ